MAFRYAGSGWRVAGSIKTFGEQIHDLRGHRNSYWVDGTLGDAEHSNRVSDHNPDDDGIVRALDFYEHETGIVDAVADAIRLARDPRCKYFIHDERMFSSYPTSSYPAWTWRPYGGVNGHPDHGHLSVVADSRAEQTHPWPMPGATLIRKEDDMWQYLNISEALVRHAWTEGWLQPGTPATLDYFLNNLAKLQEATAPAGFEEDWLNFRRAVTNGIALASSNSVTAAGVPDLSGYAKVGHGHEATTTIS